MAMEINEKVTFSGDSKIDDKVAERYGASIDKMNPENLTFSRVIMDGQLRKDNREQCRADMAEFEDDVYEVQDAMLAEDAKVEDVTENETEDEQ